MSLVTPFRDRGGDRSMCRGINATNGQACRNSVSASRVFQYCHQHQSQSHQHSVNPPYPVGKLDKAFRSANGPATRSRQQIQMDEPVISIPGSYPRHSNEIQNNTSVGSLSVPDASKEGHCHVGYAQHESSCLRQPVKKPRAQAVPRIENMQATHIERIPGSAEKDMTLQKSSKSESQRDVPHNGIKHDKKNRFSVTKLLASLGCIPATASRDAVSHSLKEKGSAALPAQNAYNSGLEPLAKDKKDVKRIPRKPVDLRTKQQIDQERKIKTDRAEIERLVSTESIPKHVAVSQDRTAEKSSNLAQPTSNHQMVALDMVGHVRSDVQPFQSPAYIRTRMTHVQQNAYYIDRYANTSDYPHKSNKSMARMQEVVRSILNAALLASFSEAELQVREFVYVFRLDGDYHETPRISLKIGRSKDVNARLKQWFAQCRYRIDKLEQFETQHAVLLERMMHLEFEEDRVLKPCRCGQTHREWFDIRREDAKGRIRRAFMKWTSFADEIQALRCSNSKGGN